MNLASPTEGNSRSCLKRQVRKGKDKGDGHVFSTFTHRSKPNVAVQRVHRDVAQKRDWNGKARTWGAGQASGATERGPPCATHPFPRRFPRLLYTVAFWILQLECFIKKLSIVGAVPRPPWPPVSHPRALAKAFIYNINRVDAIHGALKSMVPISLIPLSGNLLSGERRAHRAHRLAARPA